MSADISYTYDAPAEGETQVSVTYEYNDVSHVRSVNAAFTPEGEYDPDATAIRVSEVGLGVLHKINLGVITNDPEPEQP